MYQLLVLLVVIGLVYLLAKTYKQDNKSFPDSDSDSEMVKCINCDLNLLKSEALRYEDNWYCSKKHIN